MKISFPSAFAEEKRFENPNGEKNGKCGAKAFWNQK